ncbi:unnamed protein product [Arabis nemorensis]|uniref:Uncharacterized protein n=1 Tax=Arabis nemorensis TaxID=586526 RepID=A0A565BF01_9BRAS|nr:unnamed protein product [Arabis nemorensis]
MVNHERSASQFVLVAHGCIILSIGFLLSQYQVVVDVKLAQTPAPAVIKTRFALDEISLYLGIACFLLLSNHIIDGARFFWIVGVTATFALCRMFYVAIMLYNYNGHDDGDESPHGSHGNTVEPKPKHPADGEGVNLESGTSGP